jgi:hypothetical protein
MDDILNSGGVVKEYSHSHPSGSLPFPSGYSNAPWITPSYGGGDHSVAKKYSNSIPSLKVYDANSGRYNEFWSGGHDRIKR